MIESIAWLSPDGGNVFSANAPVPLNAIVTQTDGGRWQGHSLPWTSSFAAGGDLAFATGSWSGVTHAPLTSGIYQLVAGWDGGPVVVTSFAVDTTGPMLEVTVQPAPARSSNTTTWLPNDPDVVGPAFRRDETATVVVSSESVDVDPSTIVLFAQHELEARVAFRDGGAATCAEPFCWAFEVDLSTIPMAAMRGAIGFTAVGADLLGNPADAGFVNASVTRWQWAEQLSQVISSAVIATPALGGDGTIYVARYAGSPAGIIAVAPDGGVLWEAPGVGNVAASPALGRRQGGIEVLFAQSADATGILRTVDSSGAVGGQQCVGTAGATVSKASLAIMNDGTDEVEAIGVQPGTANTTNLAALVPNGLGIKCPLGFLAVGANFPGNIVADGNSDGGTLFYADRNQKVQPCTVGGTTFTLATESPAAGFGPGNANGLALYTAAAPHLVVGAGAGGAGELFQFDLSGPLTIEWSYGGGITPVAGPVVTAANEVLAMLYVSVGNSELRTFGATGTQVVGPQPWAVDFPVSDTPGAPTPVLGADGAAYLLSNAGELLVADSATLMTRYSAAKSSAMSGVVLASPTLDCDRNHPTAAAGVLYFVSDTGLLVSYIVDAKGLDTNAPWPKYQHDARNTGNATTAITPCP